MDFVTLEMDFVPASQRLGQLEVPVTVRNSSELLLPSSTLTLTSKCGDISSSTNVPRIAPFSFAKVTLRSHIYYTPCQKPPNRITLTYGRPKVLVNYRLDMYTYTLGLQKFLPPAHSDSEDINILLFGFIGAGKSSFVNSVRTLLTPESEVLSSIPTLDQSGHTTLKLQKHSLGEFGLSVNIWDCWGLTPATFQGNELQKLLDGVYPSNWNMNDTRHKLLQSADAIGTRESRKPHCVLFFLSQGCVDDPQYMEPIKSSIRTFVRGSGTNFLLLITKLDELSQELRNDPAAWKSLPVVNSRLHEAATVTGVEPNKIFPCVNYRTETHKSFNVDYQLFNILERALFLASNSTEDSDELAF